MERQYLCIDLKSFYASVECVERGLDPMTTKLVVADPERSDKTICLAVSPALKAQGVKNRCRVFEIPKHITYIIAPPRMQKYIDYSANIYSIYLEYISKDDIHVYSIDEAFLDVTDYLPLYKMTARELGVHLMNEIFTRIGIRATCGVGSNLYLAKVALDITAKHSPDFVGILDEEKYKETLWDHKPLTDFWRIGRGISTHLEKYGINTMRQIAECDEDFLYKIFGIDAELLIDHAWGREPVTMKDIKNYSAKSHSLSSGQVLMRDYAFEEGMLIVKEMMDLLCLDMTKKNVLTDSVTLTVGYSNALKLPPAHGTFSVNTKTNADYILVSEIANLYKEIVDPAFPIRRIGISCNRIEGEDFQQFSFFADDDRMQKAKKMQTAANEIKLRFGKNAILKGMNLQESATTIERNAQIGGHKSGV